MKKPIYAALDLHSGRSVLGSMDHGGKTGARMRFATEAEALRAAVRRLRQVRRPLFLTMEAGALTRWASGIVRPLVALDYLRAAAQPADQFQSHQER